MYHYKNGTIETIKCPREKLKHNSRGREHPSKRGKRKKLEKDKKREEKIISDVKNIFRLKKGIDGNTIKSIRSLFRLKKK